MKFGEKLRKLRTEKSLTQDEVSKAIGVSRRTYVSYEQDGRYPRKREVYAKLADVFKCEVNYLMTEDEEFVVQASEQHGSRGMKQAKDLIEGMSGLFAGGTLSEQDKDAVMKALQDIYWESKARNVEKYTSKKYKKTGVDAEE